jgi:hypothetical protein
VRPFFGPKMIMMTTDWNPGGPGFFSLDFNAPYPPQ